MRATLVIILLVIIATGTNARADTLRCGSKIVNVGMTQNEVRKYCGAPSSTEIEEHDVRSGNRVVGKTQLHIWTYKRGSTQDTAVLEFDQDTLLSITFKPK